MVNDLQNRSATIIAELERLALEVNAAGRPGDSLHLQGFAAFVQSIENALGRRPVDMQLDAHLNCGYPYCLIRLRTLLSLAAREQSPILFRLIAATE